MGLVSTHLWTEHKEIGTARFALQREHAHARARTGTRTRIHESNSPDPPLTACSLF